MKRQILIEDEIYRGYEEFINDLYKKFVDCKIEMILELGSKDKRFELIGEYDNEHNCTNFYLIGESYLASSFYTKEIRGKTYKYFGCSEYNTGRMMGKIICSSIIKYRFLDSISENEEWIEYKKPEFNYEHKEYQMEKVNNLIHCEEDNNAKAKKYSKIYNNSKQKNIETMNNFISSKYSSGKY